MSVPVVQAERGSDFEYNVDAESLLRLVVDTRSPEVQLRVRRSRGHEPVCAMLRTFETFALDANGKLVAIGTTGAHECRVTRTAMATGVTAVREPPTPSSGP
jgi:hypothetical protein